MATGITPRTRFAEVTAFDPFRDIDDLFGTRRMRSVLRNLPDEPQIRMDVKETPDAYQVKAEIPGVTRDDIQVEIDGNSVSISAEVRRDQDERKEGDLLCSERFYGRQSRTFSVRQDVDAAKAEARYHDGILDLTLPKKAGGASKQLTVK